MQADKEAFSALYRQHYRSIHGYVRAVYPSYDADDVTASVFLVAWRRFSQIPASSVKAWLFGVMRNVLMNDQRSRRRRELTIDRTILERPAIATTLADESIPFETLEALRTGFEELRDADREILILAAWGGLSAEDLAVTLGINKNAATVRLHRARQRLQELVASQTDERGGEVA